MKNKSHEIELGPETYYEYLFGKGVNLRTRTITITSDIDGKLFKLVDAALSEFEQDPKTPVTIRVSSGGGEVYPALALADRIRNSCCQIITEGYGQIFSAATLVFAAGDLRRIARGAWFMHHEVSFKSKGSLSKAKALIRQTEREESAWNKAMAECSKKSEDFWRKTSKGDSYFDSSELMKLGVADVIILNKK